MSKLTATLKKQPKTYLVYINSSIKVIAAYTGLIDFKSREFCEIMLAGGAYGKDGIECYLPWNAPERTVYCVALSRDVSPKFGSAWYDWASEISKVSLSKDERRDAIKAMLGELLRQRETAGLKGTSLREAAMRTRFISWANSLKQN
jgi:hypothetical protein